jgi:hypothetical protein
MASGFSAVLGDVATGMFGNWWRRRTNMNMDEVDEMDGGVKGES